MTASDHRHAAAPGTLYVVATPIGHLGDLSARAADLLATVDVLAVEDTRVTRKLTSHLGVPAARRLTPLHDHNAARVVPGLVRRLEAGESVAIVCDAGTPLLSDPGAPLVEAAVNAGLPVVAVPGPSALLAALAIAGLPTAAFSFHGFLPSKTGKCASAIASLADRPETLVFYEAPQRLLATLGALQAGLGDRPAALCRDLTKQGESVFRGPLSELPAALADDQVWGEWVMVVEGRTAEIEVDETGVDALIDALLAEGLPTKKIRDIVARIHDLPKREIYQRILGRS